VYFPRVCLQRAVPAVLRIFTLAGLLFYLFVAPAQAQFLGQFTLSSSEEYNDNIFFAKHREHDWITSFTPSLSLLYAPGFSNIPTFTADLRVPGQIFGRHPEESNFADTVFFDAKYTNYYSPGLTFYAQEQLKRIGNSRLAQSGFFGGSTGPPVAGGPPPPIAPGNFGLGTSGSALSNNFNAVANYQYNERLSFNADIYSYLNDYQTAGGIDLTNSIGARGIYNWHDAHNLHAGYSGIYYTVRSSRAGGKSHTNKPSFINNVDIGDDYFDTFKIDLDPTLTIIARSGIAFHVGNGFRLVNSSNFMVTKVWQTASVTAGVQKGLTDSLGVAGLSNTTSFNLDSIYRFNEFLTAIGNIRFTMYDTNKTDFQIFDMRAGVQYWIAPWLSTDFLVSHRFRNSGAGSGSTNLATAGHIRSTSVFLNLSTHFELYPRLRLARGALPGVGPMSPTTPIMGPATPAQ
jgi:hypothetical protein